MTRKPLGPRTAQLPAVAIVVSRYNASVTDRLLDGAMREHGARGGSVQNAVVLDAAGAFELVAIALAAARSKKFEAVVALGCIIKGETSHDRVLGHAVTEGLVNVTLLTGVPVGLGVLTVDSPAQAEARAGGAHGNKGAEAMAAALDSAGVIATLRAGRTAARTELSRRLPDKAKGGLK